MTLRSITTSPVPGNVLPFPGSTDLGLGLDLAIVQVSRVGKDVGAAGMLEWGWGWIMVSRFYTSRGTQVCLKMGISAGSSQALLTRVCDVDLCQADPSLLPDNTDMGCAAFSGQATCVPLS